MLHKKILALGLSCLFFLLGCNQAIYNQTEGNIADVKQRVNDARYKSNVSGKRNPSLIINEGVYVDKTPMSISHRPGWLRNHIVLRGGQLPFSYYSRTISGGNKVLTHYQVGLDQAQMLSLNYSGSVKGALDLIAAKSGYVYSVNGNDIYWQAYVTRTFDIAFMPGASDYQMGKASGGGASAPSAAGGATVTGIIDDSAQSQYSNLRGTISVWRDLQSALGQLISADGKLVVSEATTSITVRDRPGNVALVGQFIANLNKNLTKQVLVKVQILEISLESNFNFGINWNAVQRAFGGGNTVQLISNNGTPISISSITGLVGGFTTAGLNNPDMTRATNPRETGVITLINALRGQGKVSLVTEPRVLCQNNQVSVVRIVDQVGYLASIQITSQGGGTGSSQITSQITPGALVTGLTLYILPKILGNKVYLQVNADLSSNLGINTITSNGATLTPGSPPPAGTSIIQVPHVSQKQFNQRSVIASGDTLILSGFRQLGNHTGATQLFESQTLGGKSSQQTNVETIVLITPIVLNGLA